MITAANIGGAGLLAAVLILGLIVYAVAFIAARGAKRGSRD